MLPREKFLKTGIDSLSDSDLISLLVGSGIKGKDFKTISISILKQIRKEIKNGNEIQLETLSNIEGIGKITAMRILAGMELGRRVYGIYSNERITVQNSKQAYELIKNMSNLKQEHIVGIYLNSRFELLDQKTIRIGGIDNSQLLPRDVISYALESNASYVIIAHNHPSGDCTPSNEDIQLTKRLKQAMDIMGVTMLEHLVIAKNGWKSIDV
ncbi:MAG: DNA repair protein RadC [Candidatus Dojkabacteria bacterium]|nr:DNA repair protein RadC [Candidatus Dojkabacteria bacterium]